MDDAAAAGSAPGATPATRGYGPRAARTAARLRAAAEEAFAELGWDRTRVQDIVARAGVSHGTFYNYYDNRTAVLEAIVSDRYAEIVALAADPWESDDVRGALARAIGGFVDLYERDSAVMRTWLEAAGQEKRFAALYRRSRALFVERVAEQVATVLAAAEHPPATSATAVASALTAMVEHFAYCWFVLGERHDRDEAVAALVTVWGGALNELAGFRVVEEA